MMMSQNGHDFINFRDIRFVDNDTFINPEDVILSGSLKTGSTAKTQMFLVTRSPELHVLTWPKITRGRFFFNVRKGCMERQWHSHKFEINGNRLFKGAPS